MKTTIHLAADDGYNLIAGTTTGETMQTYHKIQSVFLRDPDNHYKTFLEGQWALPEIGYLAGNEWVWTEKVDGTNIRVQWNGSTVTLGGRTEAAQIPAPLINRLRKILPDQSLSDVFPVDPESDEAPDVILFGEGYGAKIQKGGGNYSPGRCDFVLFDVMVGGLYLERENVEDIASKLDLRVVPIIGRGTLKEAIEKAREGFDSDWGSFRAEGIVMRPAVELSTRRGHRIITKVKGKDFGKP